MKDEMVGLVSGKVLPSRSYLWAVSSRVLSSSKGGPFAVRSSEWPMNHSSFVTGYSLRRQEILHHPDLLPVIWSAAAMLPLFQGASMACALQGRQAAHSAGRAQQLTIGALAHHIQAAFGQANLVPGNCLF